MEAAFAHRDCSWVKDYLQGSATAQYDLLNCAMQQITHTTPATIAWLHDCGVLFAEDWTSDWVCVVVQYCQEAILQGRFDVAELLQECADVMLGSEEYEKICDLAVEKASVHVYDIVRYAIQKGELESIDRSVLDEAVQQQNFPLARWLLKNGCDWNFHIIRTLENAAFIDWARAHGYTRWRCGEEERPRPPVCAEDNQP